MKTARKQIIAFSATIILSASACTTINTDSPPPADFPALVIHEHAVKFGEFWGHCYKYVGWGWRLMGALPSACAEVNFAQNRCDVWYPQDSITADVREHELEHCRGFDHPGDSTIRSAWLSWKASRGNAAQ